MNVRASFISRMKTQVDLISGYLFGYVVPIVVPSEIKNPVTH